MGQSDGVVPERASWNKPLEFVLSCLGYAVGLGNVWRFPYLCYQNGGGAFLVAYFIMLIVMGLPIFLLELALGQYTGLGPDEAFTRIAPIFNGIGYCTLVVITLVTIYYMVIIAWTIFYFFASFTSELDFGSCSNEFNTNGCYSVVEDSKCGETETFYNKTCTSIEVICANNGGYLNKTYCKGEGDVPEHLSKVIKDRQLATYEYFNNYVLGADEASWENFGGLRWQLVLCLLLAWIIGYMCVVRGVKSSGKAVYFTALFPYVMLTVLVIVGCTLDGAVDGILLYIKPDWEKLLEAKMWGNAASQTFYSFGIGCGSLITLSSYSDFKNNCLKDAIIVAAANAFTSIYAGFAIFSMLGFLAFKLDVPVAEVATDGPGLAFVAYPEALLQLPVPTVWALIFFFMLFILGLGSQFAGIEAISTTILDRWPHLRKRQVFVTLGICICCFLLGLPMCCNGGIFIFTLMEWNTASWAILLIGLAEVGSVAWAYGCNRFLDNIAEMGMELRKPARWFWWTCWCIITPIALLGVFVFQMTTFTLASYEDYTFPPWADSLGIMMGVATLIPLPLFAIYALFKYKYSGWEWFQPTDAWGPQASKSESNQTLSDTLEAPIEKF
ncbi:PREDICTED: sodium- and chloride-dependent GABA transporter 2-like isoform X1 [Nicrophorus vespilloides]|uniref:Transporter n=1 Tax=Nicrophorus vespilloides TaxID=110193 RepID=A0ABM1NF62_NICVS|nr:PREDICTED: sodium- and chloride-dependent GABA transporter 2-like isoform X1 [Nicrophorus vespilloides]